jgi:hypothetical protein
MNLHVLLVYFPLSPVPFPVLSTPSIIMASRDLEQPLLGQPKAGNSIILSAASIIINVTIIVIAYMVIKDDPICDQSLITWTKWIIGVTVGAVVVELLKMAVGKNGFAICMQSLLGLVFLVVWIWGHWPVFESETCDESLWNFAFVMTLLGDIGVGIGVLAVCLLLCFGGAAALMASR